MNHAEVADRDVVGDRRIAGAGHLRTGDHVPAGSAHRRRTLPAKDTDQATSTSLLIHPPVRHGIGDMQAGDRRRRLVRVLAEPGADAGPNSACSGVSLRSMPATVHTFQSLD
ncbi:hypothetical protein GKE82_26560 [Conexibacter sp. W3-3-2]|uniref:hypothetical protein n=1 Tax=Conexibacter sp. W3-3-2 TaxID=2675227 RepID=UPI0012B80683|nr:hypothetical protein [Conexibacter sp. W3-3-2]MTD47763.1 hypothetical protein [Conexibacter sp. W3-3-2]